MIVEILALLLYLGISDTWISNQNNFRSFHCSSLSLLSLKNTMRYGMEILNTNNPIQRVYLIESDQTYNFYSHPEFYLKFITIYFIMYTLYDFKNCYKSKRIDLFIHHTVCLLWSSINSRYVIGHISFNILSEGITFAYNLSTFKNQLIYRLLFICFVRLPVWTTSAYFYFCDSSFASFRRIPLLDVFNRICISCMFLMDFYWLKQNYKKLKHIWNENDKVKTNRISE